MTNNYVDSSGLVLQSLADIITELETGFKTIYGSDINIDPNSPDGQMIALFAQAKIDILDCISGVYGSFSPQSAIGAALDQRCALNGVSRQGAVKCICPVNIYTDRQVALVGEDTPNVTPFTAMDAASNKFYLITGFTAATGSTGASFRAAEAGSIEVTAGSINAIKTIILGVTGVYNTLTPTTVGVDEETDAALRIRRAQSVGIPSTGFLDGLKAGLLAIDSVTHAEVYENPLGVTGATGEGSLPPHSMWAVVEGGTTGDISDMIYRKRNAGCSMTGATGVNVTQANGFDLPILWSPTTLRDLYIALTLTSLNTDWDPTPNAAAIKQTIYDNITYGINEMADYSAISSIVKENYPYAVIISGYVGTTGATGSPYMAPATLDSRWVIATSRITLTVI